MFLHESTETLVTIRRQLRRTRVSPAVLEFVDVSSLQVMESVVTTTGFQVQQAGDLFVVTGQTDEGVALSIGRVQAQAIELNVEVTPDGMTLLGDESLLDGLPYRLDAGPGMLVDRSKTGLHLRAIDVDRHLGEPYPNEMPAAWRITPDRRHAIIWRLKGSIEWPVVDLDTDKVVHQIHGLGYNEPRLAFEPGGRVFVGVYDQLHTMDSIMGQLSSGIRLKEDNSGSHINSLALANDGMLLVMWFGRGEPPALAGIESVDELWDVIRTAQRGDPRVLMNRKTHGAVLRIEPATCSVTEAAPFADWVVDPAMRVDQLVALEWATRKVVRSRFGPVVWPTHPPREPGEKMWF